MSPPGFCYYVGEMCDFFNDRERCNEEPEVRCRTKRQKNEVKGRWPYAEAGKQEEVDVDL